MGKINSPLFNSEYSYIGKINHPGKSDLFGVFQAKQGSALAANRAQTRANRAEIIRAEENNIAGFGANFLN